MKRKHILGLSYSDQQKLWSKIQICGEDECWEWQDSLKRDGYGTFYPEGSKIGFLAHRITLFLKTGEQDIIARHQCDNRACCNPNHLDVVTAQMNTLRGHTLAAKEALKTHCPQGHPYSGANLYRKPRKNGRFARICLTCRRAQQRLLNHKYRSPDYLPATR